MKHARRLIITTLCLLFFLSGCITQDASLIEATPFNTIFATPTATPTPSITPSPTTAPKPTFSPTSEPTDAPILIPRYLQWASPNQKEKFSDQDIKNLLIYWDMPREKAIAKMGSPFTSEAMEEDGLGDTYIFDTYRNGNEFWYIENEENGAYTLSFATIKSKDIAGPRGLRVGDTAKKVLSSFYIDNDIFLLYDYIDLATVLYGDILYDYRYTAFAPSGMVWKEKSLAEKSMYRISYYDCPQDDTMYQLALAGETNYYAVRLYYCTFTITDEKVSAMSWRYGASAE